MVGGFAAEQIIEKSVDDKEAFIVIGSSESSQSLQTIFGSVSTEVAKNSSCPVFVIPPNVNYSPFNRIAFCISDEPVDNKFINDLLGIAN